MLTPTTPCHKDLGDGMVLRSVADRNDVDRVAAFQETVHGEGVADMTRHLILDHPYTRLEHWLYVEDQSNEKVVSAICLIPWRLQYQGIELTAGEMGIVATDPDYRRRGLVRVQVARHQQLLCEGGFDLSHIQGIPYFYRQFGYDYAIPLEGGWRVDLHTVPASQEGVPTYALRQASLDDLSTLVELYDRAAQDLEIHVQRDEAEWCYLLGPSMQTEMIADTYLVTDIVNRVVAYLRVPHDGFGEGLIVNEVSRMNADTARAVLGLVRDLAVIRSKPYIRLCLPGNSTLVQVARYLGAHDLGHYAWQVKILDRASLLRKMAPVLERRLAGSSLRDLSQGICLDLYREAYELKFQEGKLVSVQPLSTAEHGGIRIPPRLFAPLVLGYRTREELASAHHDFSVSRDWQLLFDVLFCPATSFLYTIY